MYNGYFECPGFMPDLRDSFVNSVNDGSTEADYWLRSRLIYQFINISDVPV